MKIVNYLWGLLKFSPGPNNNINRIYCSDSTLETSEDRPGESVLGPEVVLEEAQSLQAHINRIRFNSWDSDSDYLDEEEKNSDEEPDWGRSKNLSISQGNPHFPKQIQKSIHPVNFVLRGVDLKDSRYTHSSEDLSTIMNNLFSSEFKGLSKDDPVLINTIYNMVMNDSLYGMRPILPFTLETFFEYLFMYCRDLQVIRLLLRFCSTSPGFLNDYDRTVKETREDGYGIRELYMLPFLWKMKKIDESESTRLTFQLMGFRNFKNLKLYYAESSFAGDEFIAGQLFLIERLFVEELFNEPEDLSRSGDDCYSSV